MIAAGSLDRRITLLRATLARGGDFNEAIETWETLATVWASRRDVTDVERERAAQIGGDLTARFVIRWSSTVSDLSAADQIESEGRRFQITGVRELSRREALEISAIAKAEPERDA